MGLRLTDRLCKWSLLGLISYNLGGSVIVPFILLWYHDTPSSSPSQGDYNSSSRVPTHHVPLQEVHGCSEEICSQPLSTRRNHCPILWHGYVDFIPDIDPIGVPESRHEGRLSGKGTLWKKTYIGTGSDYLNKAHYIVLQNSALVDLYIEVHKDFIRSEWPGKNEAWIRCHHMETICDRLRKEY